MNHRESRHERVLRLLREAVGPDATVTLTGITPEAGAWVSVAMPVHLRYVVQERASRYCREGRFVRGDFIWTDAPIYPTHTQTQPTPGVFERVRRWFT